MKSFLLPVLLFMTISAYSQKNAVTDDGEEVILYDNGTWKYIIQPEPEAEIKVNPVEYTKPKDATFTVKATL
ncbi:MAG: hypothetical protein HC905_12845 [Bacteroidales bacterium]|nr:hypothetical protein [Bacteroidales bacterium]